MLVMVVNPLKYFEFMGDDEYEDLFPPGSSDEVEKPFLEGFNLAWKDVKSVFDKGLLSHWVAAQRVVFSGTSKNWPSRPLLSISLVTDRTFQEKNSALPEDIMRARGHAVGAIMAICYFLLCKVEKGDKRLDRTLKSLVQKSENFKRALQGDVSLPFLVKQLSKILNKKEENFTDVREEALKGVIAALS